MKPQFRLAGTLAAAIATAVLVVLTALASEARADRLDQAWKRGNDAYLRGDYVTAIAAYQELDRQGVVASDLYFNLGNAHYRQGQLGHAIWGYERAVTLNPDDDDAAFNLAQARKLAARRAQDKIEGADREPLWIRVVTALSPSTETWLFVTLYLGCFATLLLRRRAQEHARVAFTAVAAILGVSALLAGSLLAGRAFLDRAPYAIVLPDSIAVKEGADVNYRTSFQLHAGLRLRVLDRDQDWLRIRLPNGLEGWVREQEVGRL